MFWDEHSTQLPIKVTALANHIFSGDWQNTEQHNICLAARGTTKAWIFVCTMTTITDP